MILNLQDVSKVLDLPEDPRSVFFAPSEELLDLNKLFELCEQAKRDSVPLFDKKKKTDIRFYRKRINAWLYGSGSFAALRKSLFNPITASDDEIGIFVTKSLGLPQDTEMDIHEVRDALVSAYEKIWTTNPVRMLRSTVGFEETIISAFKNPGKAIKALARLLRYVVVSNSSPDVMFCYNFCQVELMKYGINLGFNSWRNFVETLDKKCLVIITSRGVKGDFSSRTSMTVAFICSDYSDFSDDVEPSDEELRFVDFIHESVISSAAGARAISEACKLVQSAFLDLSDSMKYIERKTRSLSGLCSLII